MGASCRLAAGAAALLLLACACGESPDRTGGGVYGGGDQVAEPLSGGGVRVSSGAEGLWRGGEEWRLVEELRVGTAEGTGPDLFGAIGQVAPGPSGELLVLDSQAQQVQVFDATGAHLHTVGRPGGGPGEFQGAFGLAFDPADRLWVVDGGNGRYSLFDRSGAFLTSHPRRVPGVVYPWMGRFGSTGVLYDPTVAPTPSGSTAFVPFAVDTAGQLVDSLAPLELPRRGEQRPMPIAVGMLSPRLTFRLAADGGLWFGSTDRYTLYRRTPAGDTTLIVERTVPREKVTEEDVNAILAGAQREYGIQIPRGDIPRERPYFHRLIVEDDGHLWVQRAGSGMEDSSRFDIFDPEGRYLGEVRSPVPLAWMTAAEIHGDHLFGAVGDELGVPYAVRLRIVR